MQEKYRTAFCDAADPAHFTEAFQTEEEAMQHLQSEYEKASWKHLGRFHQYGTIPMHYQLPKFKDIVADCDQVRSKKGTCCRQRPILPYTNHPLRNVYKRGGKALAAVVKSLPAGQFDIDRVSSVRNAILQANADAMQKHGRGRYRWVSLVGDLSCMYDELDPAVAVDRVRTSCDRLPAWLGKRKARLTGVHMGWNSKLATMGKPTSDNKVFLSFADLVGLCDLDCSSTLYSFGGKVNRRKFGVPMGGFMSPQLARLYCSTTELAMERPPGLEDMVGFVVRYMDDIFAVYAVREGHPADERVVRDWFKVIETSYPDPLYLTVEDESSQARFLELLIDTSGDEITCCLYNPVVEEHGIPRLPHWCGGESMSEKQSRLFGQIHRVTEGSSHRWCLIRGVCGIMAELRLSGWPISILSRTLQMYGQHSSGTKLWQSEVDDLGRTLLSLLYNRP